MVRPTRDDLTFARRHRRKKKRTGAPFSLVGLRVRDLETLWRDRYGAALPDDDAGRDDLVVMVHHLARYATGDPRARITAWAATWAPWIQPDDLEAISDRALTKPLRWRADTLAQRVGLVDADRTRLGITTIGAIDLTATDRRGRRKERDRLAKQAKRRAAPQRPRRETLTERAPWGDLGISRATWYRQRAA